MVSTSPKGFALIIAFTNYNQSEDFNGEALENVDMARNLGCNVRTFLERQPDEWNVTTIFSSNEFG